MQISTLSNLKLDDAKEFEILDPLTGKRSQTYNPKTKKLEDTPAFISLFYMGSKKMKKVQLELQRKIIELAKDKSFIQITSKSFVKDLFLFSNDTNFLPENNFVDVEPNVPLKIKLNLGLKFLPQIDHFSLFDLKH